MDARVVLSIALSVLGAHPALASAHSIPSSAIGAPPIPSAYQAAALASGIPSQLLWAVALQESGRYRRSRLVPWPWTLNIAGVSARFATRAQACRALHRALQRTSPRRIDVGLMQVNWGYHHDLVRSPCELLDPYRNLTVASRLLCELHQEGESWLATAAHYHRPAGGGEATRYAESLQRRLLSLKANAQRTSLAARPLTTVGGLGR
jgi:hypothetical protein